MPEPRQFIVTRPGDAGMCITIKAEDFEATQTGVTFYNEPDAEIGSLRRWRDRLIRSLDQLRGRDLQCWCALTVPCHADVLLDVANAPLIAMEIAA